MVDPATGKSFSFCAEIGSLGSCAKVVYGDLEKDKSSRLLWVLEVINHNDCLKKKSVICCIPVNHPAIAATVRSAVTCLRQPETYHKVSFNMPTTRSLQDYTTGHL